MIHTTTSLTHPDCHIVFKTDESTTTGTDEKEDVSIDDRGTRRDVDVEGGGVDVADDDTDSIRDHCRELMMRGECDEQYHSDDDSFIISGDGDQKILN